MPKQHLTKFIVAIAKLLVVTWGGLATRNWLGYYSEFSIN